MKLEQRKNLKHSDLAHGDLVDEGVVLGLCELLDGHHLAGVAVLALEHHAVAALADLAELFVPVHNKASALCCSKRSAPQKDKWVKHF